MTKVLTIRISPDLLSKAEAKAAQLGMDRAKYLRSLVEDDVRSTENAPRHRFASEDLVGIHSEKPSLPATNARTTEMMRRKILAQRERNC